MHFQDTVYSDAHVPTHGHLTSDHAHYDGRPASRQAWGTRVGGKPGRVPLYGMEETRCRAVGLWSQSQMVAKINYIQHLDS